MVFKHNASVSVIRLEIVRVSVLADKARSYCLASSLTDSCFCNLIDVALADEDAYSKFLTLLLMPKLAEVLFAV